MDKMEKAEVGRVRERERLRRKKMQAREKVGKPRNTMFFQFFVALEGRKVSRLPKAAGVEPCDQRSCTPLWREAHFQVKMHKNIPC